MFRENRLGKYLIYALGEIVLVVIGILIALQINNWNEDRKKQIQIETVLEIVQDNLKSDTTELNYVISAYDNLDSLITIVLEDKYPQAYFDTINETNFKNCLVCFGLNTIIYNFYPETKGYGLLKTNNTFSKQSEDKQLQKIIKFYEQRIGRITEMRKYNMGFITENLRAREQYSWHLDYCNQKYNKEFITYFSQNQLYKNKLASFKVIAIGNYVAILKMYKEEAIKLLEEFKSTE